MSAADTDEPTVPAFEVVAGGPTEEEIAALAVIFAALAGPAAPTPTGTQPRRGRYNSYWRSIRRTFFTGRETWNSQIRQF